MQSKVDERIKVTSGRMQPRAPSMAQRACSTSITLYREKVLGSADSPCVSCISHMHAQVLDRFAAAVQTKLSRGGVCVAADAFSNLCLVLWLCHECLCVPDAHCKVVGLSWRIFQNCDSSTNVDRYPQERADYVC